MSNPSRKLDAPDQSPAPLRADVVVRQWTPSDAVSPITALLHRAYAKQVEMGLKPLAARQDDQVTLRRLSSGEPYIAQVASTPHPAGIIILNEHEPDEGPAWFSKPGVCAFSQFAVEPTLQGKGIGHHLLTTVEARAKELNNSELALSMAEPDHDLRNYYIRRGYRIVGVWKWPYTNYASLIMSKRL
jgi:GNAT superfamily N-acetyltransferase